MATDDDDEDRKNYRVQAGSDYLPDLKVRKITICSL